MSLNRAAGRRYAPLERDILMVKKKRVGEVLMDAGLINETQLAAALQSQRTWGGKLGSTLVRMGFAREEDILRALSSQLLLPAVDFNKVKVSARAIASVPLRIAEKYHVIPVALREEQGKKELVLVMSDPTNLDSITEIEFQTGYRVRAAVATDSAILRAIDFYYRSQGTIAQPEFPKTPIGVSELGETETMQLVSDDRKPRGEKAQDLSVMESVSTAGLLKALIRILIKKDVISKTDLTEELTRMK